MKLRNMIIHRPEYKPCTKLSTPEDTMRFMRPVLKKFDEAQEHAFVVGLDIECDLLKYHIINVGVDDLCLFSFKDLWKYALGMGASQIIVGHTHTCKLTRPSRDDDLGFENLMLGSALLGVPIADVIILGTSDEFYSYAQKGLLDLQFAVAKRTLCEILEAHDAVLKGERGKKQ